MVSVATGVSFCASCCLRFLQLACAKRTKIGKRHNPHTPAMTYATVSSAVSELSVSMYSQSTASEIEKKKTKKTEND